MNFDDTPQEAAFRAEARKWIDANAPKQFEAELSKSSLGRIKLKKRRHRRGRKGLAEEESRWRLGLPALAEGIWRPRRDAGRARDLAAGRGRLRQAHQSVPDRRGHVRADGDGLWQRSSDKRRYLPKIASGEEIWCQLFSEPAGGSDVAGLRTRAERDGDHWIINGQKIWTSGAHYSDYGLLITRTDPNVPKHKGLTMFFIDMKSRGVEVQADQAGQRHAGIQRGVLHRPARFRIRSGSAPSATAGTSR